jgi:hypothetical protein
MNPIQRIPAGLSVHIYGRKVWTESGRILRVTQFVPWIYWCAIGQRTTLGGEIGTYYRSGVNKLMHLKQRGRSDMANAVSYLLRYNTNGSEEHIDAMHRAMRFAVSTPIRGLNLSPVGEWDGNPG